jgi:hypothetical protein
MDSRFRGNDDSEANHRFLRVPDASCAPLTYSSVGKQLIDLWCARRTLHYIIDKFGQFR